MAVSNKPFRRGLPWHAQRGFIAPGDNITHMLEDKISIVGIALENPCLIDDILDDDDLKKCLLSEIFAF